MDEDRQIRFLICPFLLYCSLLWWGYVSPETYKSFANLKPESLKEFLPIIAAAGAATLPVGYSIGTITILLLRFFFWIRNRSAKERQIYEAWLSGDSYEAILKKLTHPTRNRDALLYAAASFDHGLLPDGIHKWMMRRWNSFNIASNSALALFISLLVVPVRIAYTWSWEPICGWDYKLWLIVNLVLIALLCTMAYFSWHETMQMLEFQSERSSFDLPKDNTPRMYFE